MMENGRPPAIGAQGVFFQIEAKTLLDRADLNAAHGQMVGLIGPNGAGKSTFLRAISGVLRVQSGNIHLDGADLRSLTSKEVAAGLAIVPQIVPYTHGFTAMELVLMGRYPHLGRFQIEGQGDERIARNAMRQTETEQFADRTLDTLSGGERQRVIVSRALAQQPRILLLDEPTANLDVLHQLKVLGLVRQLVDDGLTAVAAIHDLNMASRFCDRLVLLQEGRVLAEGAPEEVLTPQANLTSLRRKSRRLPRPQHRIPRHQPNRPRGQQRRHRQRPRSRLPASQRLRHMGNRGLLSTRQTEL